MVFQYCFFEAWKELPLNQRLALMSENKICFVCFFEIDRLMQNWAKCYGNPYKTAPPEPTPPPQVGEKKEDA